MVVVDNASMDGTRGILARYENRIRVSYNNTNLGFAAAQNQAITRSSSDWVLVLNPDVVLSPGFVEQLMAAATVDPRVGTICGRLLGDRVRSQASPETTHRFGRPVFYSRDAAFRSRVGTNPMTGGSASWNMCLERAQPRPFTAAR